MKDKQSDYEIVECFGVLSVDPDGWQLELNKVSWYGQPAEFDLRFWSKDHTEMNDGMTLTDEEASNLRDVLAKALKS